jgi:D-glycero-alpha-D-manno-heptose 1-phosphate guanylyltransferase
MSSTSAAGGREAYEAIILAGGLGTRLREVVSGLPKCMAPVNGKPFLHYVLEHLRSQDVNSFIFSLGYKSEVIEDYGRSEMLDVRFSNCDVRFTIEQEPLGTGGAIKLACDHATRENVIVVNGDTLFSFEASALMSFHKMNEADCTLSLKPMEYFSRYGAVELNDDYAITSFKEKQHFDKGLINGGVYALNVNSFLKEALPEKFSFEKDYLEKFVGKRRFFGVTQDKYFIDIGIPEDYQRAQQELK